MHIYANMVTRRKSGREWQGKTHADSAAHVASQAIPLS